MISRRTLATLLAASLGAAIVAGPDGSTAQGAASTYTWNGGDSSTNNWSSAINWSGTAAVSGSTTDLVFASLTNSATSNNNLANPFILNQLTFNSGLGNVTLSGSQLSFQGTTPTIQVNNDNVTFNTPLDFAASTTLKSSGGSNTIYFNGQLTSSTGTGTLTYTSNAASEITNFYFDSSTGSNTINGFTFGSEGSSGSGNCNIYIGMTNPFGGSGTTLWFANPGTTSSVYALGGSQSIASGIEVRGNPTFAGTNSMTFLGNWVMDPTGVSSARTFTNSMTGGSTLTLAAGSGATFDIRNLTFTGAGTTIIPGVISDSGQYPIKAITAGTLVFSGTGNTYTGQTSVSGGTLEFTTVANAGINCSLGAPTGGTATINLGSTTATGTLMYIGTDSSHSSSSRTINLAGTTGGGVLNASGAVPLTFTGGVTATGTGAKTLTLTGTNSGYNTLGGSIVDSATNSFTSLTKSGVGLWVLTGANTYSGLTTISGGTLQIGNNGATGTLSSTASVSDNATLAFGRNDTAYVAANVISGTGAVAQVGTGLTQLSASNGYSGGTLVSAGTLQVGNPWALGSSSGTLLVNGGALDLNSNNPQVGSVTLAAGSIINSGAASSLTGASYTLQSGTVSANLGDNNGSTLTKSTNGLAVLSGSNSYSGATNVNGGTLAVNGSLAAASSVAVNAGGTLAGNGSIGGSLTINGNGALMPSYGGSGGTLSIGSLALSASNILNYTLPSSPSASPYTFLSVGGNVTWPTSGNVTLDLFNVAGGSLALGTYPLMSIGGVLTGTPSSAFTIGNDQSAGQETYNLVPAGNLLDLVISPATVSAVNGVWSNTSHGTWSWANAGNWVGGGVPGTTLPGDTATFGPGLSSGGTATVTLDGARTLGALSLTTTNGSSYVLALAATDSTSFLTLGSGGGTATVSVGGGSHAITVPITMGGNNLTVTATTGASLTVSGPISQTNPGATLGLSGGGLLVLAGNNGYTGGTTVNSGTLQIGSGGGGASLASQSVSMSGGAMLAFNHSDAVTYGGAIGGNGSLWHTGGGTLALAGNNTFGNGLTIQAGTVVGTVANAFGGSGAGAVTLGDVTGGSNPATLIANPAASTTYSNPITVAANTSGLLTIGQNGGAAVFAGQAALNNNLTLSAMGTSSMTLSGPIIDTASHTITINNTGSGPNCNATLSGVNTAATFNSNIFVQAGTLVVGNSSGLTSANVVQVANGATFNLDGVSPTIAGLNDVSGGTGGTVGAISGNATLTLGGGGTYSYNGAVSNGAQVLGLTIALSGGGQQTLGGANTYTGVTTVNSGTLVAGNPTAFGPAASASLVFGANSTGTVQLNGNSMTVIGLATNATPGTPIVENANATPATLTINNAGADTYAGVIQDGGAPGTPGPLSLNKGGGGTLYLSGANTYSGSTSVSAGVLQFTQSAAWSSSSAVSVGGGTLAVNAGGTGEFGNGTSGPGTIGGLFAQSTFATGTAFAIDTTNAGGSLTYAGAFGGNGGLVKLGGGALILTGANNYAGATTISSGTLQIGSGSPAGSLGAGPVTDNGTLTFDRPDNYGGTVANGIGGNGTLTVAAGMLALSGVNTYSGATTISGGTLATGGNNCLPTGGTLNFAGNGVLNLGPYSQTMSNLTVANSTTGTITGGTLTVNSGPFNLAYLGTNNAQTLDMAGLGAFVFSKSTAAFNVGFATAAVSPVGVLTLAGASNMVSASSFNLGNGTASDGSTTAVGTVYLGQTNTIDADAILIGDQKADGLLKFQAGLGGNPTLTIRGAAGNDAAATMIVGTDGGGQVVYSSTVDLTTGVSGTSTLDASLGTLTIGQNTRTTAGSSPTGSISTFIMGGGTLAANLIVIGQDANGGSKGTATGTLTDGSGLVSAGTLTLADRNSAVDNNVTGTFNLNGGTLSATAVSKGNYGSGSGTSTANFNWNNGTIEDSASGLTFGPGINVSLASAGTHTLEINSGYPAGMASVLSGTGGTLVKDGSGLLTLSAANTYSGGTTVNGGTLQLGGGGSLASSVSVAPGATLAAASGTNIGGSLTLATSGPGVGGTLSLLDNSIGVFNVGGGLNVAAAGGGPASAARLMLEISGGAIDAIQLGSAASLGNGAVVVGVNYISTLGLLSSGSYTFLSDPAGGLGGFRFSLASGTISDGASLYSMDLYASSGTAEVLTLSPYTGGNGGTWGSNLVGNWSVQGNWQNGALPVANGSATFGNSVGSSATVTLDVPVSLSALTFNSTAAYTLSGTNSLTLGSGGVAMATVTSGTHNISAPVVLAGSLAVNTTDGAALFLSGSVSEAMPGSGSISLSGDGALILSGTSSYTGGTTVNSGTLYLANSTALPAESNLTVDAGGTFIFDPSVTWAAVSGQTLAASSAGVAAVPEPCTLALLLAGLAVFGVWRRRKTGSGERGAGSGGHAPCSLLKTALAGGRR